ncbi:MAG TPA: hypothetical protein VMT32_05695 [Bryobacteraceae bacterium]|nr:hypothetical protein [Bryobacteraceae bacterium]
MVKAFSAPSIAALLLAALASGNSAGQTPRPKVKEFPLWKFDKMTTYPTCRAKGRLQDKGYCESKLIDQIIAQGKASIPVLISQLTDTRTTEQPIYDFWSYTTAGDIAYFILTSLFTDSDWKTFNMSGLESLNEPCDEPAETCWRKFLGDHGRKFVQDRWRAAWNANADRVYWDENARCFRLSPNERTK